MKALVGTFNKEKALVGASVIVILQSLRRFVSSSDGQHSPGGHAHPGVARVRGAGVVGEVYDAEQGV